MNITLKLDTKTIDDLVSRLEFFKDHIGEGLVNILCIEGAMVANGEYDGMATAEGGVTQVEDGITTGQIIATSENEDKLLIAEFGAGDATIYANEHFETHELDADVFPGAYSLFKGTRDYYNFGFWRFGGKWMTEVPARNGMFYAKHYILDNYARLAEEVIRFD